MHLFSNSDVPVEIVFQDDGREKTLLYSRADGVDVRSPSAFWLFAPYFFLAD